MNQITNLPHPADATIDSRETNIDSHQSIFELTSRVRAILTAYFPLLFSSPSPDR